MAIYDDIANEFVAYTDNQVTRIFNVFSLFSNVGNSSKSSLKKSNSSKIAEQAVTKLNSGGVEATVSELQPLIEELLENPPESVYSWDAAYYKILQIIGTSFLVNQDSIFYISQIAARRIIALISFEVILLNGLSRYTNYLANYLKNTDSYTENQSNFYAYKMSEAQKYIDKITLAINEDKASPTSVDEFNKLINGIFNEPEVSSTSKFLPPSESIRKIINYNAYLDRIHPQIVEAINWWMRILDDYIELDIPNKISKGILEKLNEKINYWKEYFVQTNDEVKFTHLKDLLSFLSGADKTVSTLFNSPTPKGVIEEDGIIHWVDDNDGNSTTKWLSNPGTLEAGDTISVHSPTLDSDGISIASHKILGVSTNYIWVDPEIEQPIEGTAIYFVKYTDGSTYYGKYKAIKDFLADKPIPESFELSPHNTDDLTRKDLGASIWGFINRANDTDLSLITSRNTNVQTKITSLINNLEEVRDTLMGLSLPRQSNLEYVDDILLDHNLNNIRDYYLAGRIKDMFTTPFIESSKEMNLIGKINLLMKSV